ncbi:BatD family protein [Dasania sp. GY-MA-18]|uniref:BatD family protein n=1 Tax=Dasania phycosphaerae TaxID=2950436 RepID=A0A9J6RLD5_9GAMM|nr:MULTISPECIES: BatD family protein [Dasania]MCR8922876.1 BatD family protein [Dasania sp. GY-MA-18]MCZ0865307.1 BatD family protein [Dasania phycosphaerae]MCZ0869032.1 BatD family protein [Dasania phycosphaerae]
MVSHIKLFCFFIISLSLWLSNAYSASITATASVDRQTITVDDSLTLSIRINDTGTYKTPDLSALEKDFQIAGTSQSSRHTLINGRSNSVTEWTVTLYPKRDGLLLIPAIKINDAKTNPIAVQVNKASALPPGQLDKVFIESSVSHNSAYVQQQVLLNLSIYHSVQLDNLNMSELTLENATVKRVGQNSFYRTVQGIRHRVHEINYAIFPNKAGELIIPELVFSGQELSQSRFYGGGTLIRRKSEPHSITVKPAPADYSGDLWLPAQQLQLQETWSKDPEQLRVGDSITRSITTSANGVTAAQLPPINFKAIAGLKLYPDQAETNNSESATGISATRIDSTAIIPTRAGKITLPAINITWWDTASQSQKTASIAARELTILPPLEQGPSQRNAIDHSQATVTDSGEKVVTVANPFWMVVSFVLLGLWLITLLAYWRLSRRMPSSDKLPQQNNNKLSEKSAYKHLQQLCRQPQSEQLRPALITWAQQHWPTKEIYTLDDISRASEHPALKNLLLQYDNSRYGKTADSSDWNGASLLSIIDELRQQKSSATSDNALPDLYK